MTPCVTRGRKSTRAAELRRARVKRYRRRVANGSASLRIEIGDYLGLVDVLITNGWLSESESDDRVQVEAAVSAALAELSSWHVRRWGMATDREGVRIVEADKPLQ